MCHPNHAVTEIISELKPSITKSWGWGGKNLKTCEPEILGSARKVTQVGLQWVQEGGSHPAAGAVPKRHYYGTRRGSCGVRRWEVPGNFRWWQQVARFGGGSGDGGVAEN